MGAVIGQRVTADFGLLTKSKITAEICLRLRSGGYHEAEWQLQTSVPFRTRRFRDLAGTGADDAPIAAVRSAFHTGAGLCHPVIVTLRGHDGSGDR